MKNKFLRLFFVLLALFLCLFSASCANESNKKTVLIGISNEITGESQQGKVTVVTNTNAGQCFRSFCNTSEESIEGVDDGFITSVGGVKNDGNLAWLFYVNDTLSEVGVSESVPNDGDKIELIYQDYTVVFAQ